MSIYDVYNIADLLSANTYPGRGIIAGLTPDGTSSVAAYFIMGRSENSRNRIFCLRENGELFTRAFDESKLEDPSLIIYNAVRSINNCTIVTNGDQTDTIYDGLAAGDTFEGALTTREFEPDAPNFTPRISLIQQFDGGYSYKMSILKSADALGSACNRYTYSYSPLAGLGHFIHTYQCDGNPIPTFNGEPERIATDNDIDAFTNAVWNHLNADNKISLYVRYTNLATGQVTQRLINKHQ